MVDKVSKHTAGNQEEILSTEKFGGYKPKAKERIQIRERLALRNNVKEEHLGDIRWVKRRYRSENVFARPNGPRENVELRFRVGNLDLPESRNRYTRGQEEEEDVQMALVAKQMRVKLTTVGECEMYKEERDVLRDEENRRMWHGEVWCARECSEKTIAILEMIGSGYRRRSRTGIR